LDRETKSNSNSISSLRVVINGKDSNFQRNQGVVIFLTHFTELKNPPHGTHPLHVWHKRENKKKLASNIMTSIGTYE
jgi:hypothetical protein